MKVFNLSILVGMCAALIAVGCGGRDVTSPTTNPAATAVSPVVPGTNIGCQNGFIMGANGTCQPANQVGNYPAQNMCVNQPGMMFNGTGCVNYNNMNWGPTTCQLYGMVWNQAYNQCTPGCPINTMSWFNQGYCGGVYNTYPTQMNYPGYTCRVEQTWAGYMQRCYYTAGAPYSGMYFGGSAWLRLGF